MTSFRKKGRRAELWKRECGEGQSWASMGMDERRKEKRLGDGG